LDATDALSVLTNFTVWTNGPQAAIDTHAAGAVLTRRADRVDACGVDTSAIDLTGLAGVAAPAIAALNAEAEVADLSIRTREVLTRIDACTHATDLPMRAHDVLADASAFALHAPQAFGTVYADARGDDAHALVARQAEIARELVRRTRW